MDDGKSHSVQGPTQAHTQPQPVPELESAPVSSATHLTQPKTATTLKPIITAAAKKAHATEPVAQTHKATIGSMSRAKTRAFEDKTVWSSWRSPPKGRSSSSSSSAVDLACSARARERNPIASPLRIRIKTPAPIPLVSNAGLAQAPELPTAAAAATAEPRVVRSVSQYFTSFGGRIWQGDPRPESSMEPTRAHLRQPPGIERQLSEPAMFQQQRDVFVDKQSSGNLCPLAESFVETETELVTSIKAGAAMQMDMESAFDLMPSTSALPMMQSTQTALQSTLESLCASSSIGTASLVQQQQNQQTMMTNTMHEPRQDLLMREILQSNLLSQFSQRTNFDDDGYHARVLLALANQACHVAQLQLQLQQQQLEQQKSLQQLTYQQHCQSQNELNDLCEQLKKCQHQNILTIRRHTEFDTTVATQSERVLLSQEPMACPSQQQIWPSQSPTDIVGSVQTQQSSLPLDLHRDTNYEHHSTRANVVNNAAVIPPLPSHTVTQPQAPTHVVYQNQTGPTSSVELTSAPAITSTRTTTLLASSANVSEHRQSAPIRYTERTFVPRRVSIGKRIDNHLSRSTRRS